MSGAATAAQQEAAAVPAPVTPVAPPEVAPTETAPVTTEPPPEDKGAIERSGTPEEIAKAQEDARILAEDERFKDPEKVLDDPERVKQLAVELDKHHGHPGDSAFAAEFVRRFGAKNLIGLTRTLQAYEHGYRKGMMFDDQSHMRGVDQGDHKPHDWQEARGILYSFSATLATASHSLDEKTKDEILKTDDRIGLGWLMSNPDAQFDKDFLVKAFDQVQAQIMHDAWDQDPMARGRIGTGMGGFFPDPKIGILDAISRNPEAAAEIVNRPDFKNELLVPRGMSGPSVEVKNVLGLLNQGIYADRGAALGRMLDAAHRGIQANDPAAAKALTWRMIDNAATRKEVEQANRALVEIARKDAFDEAECARAREMLDKNDKHPGREALETMILDSPAQVARFADDAANGKVDKDLLYQTAGAWEIIKQASLAEDASGEQRRDAEKTLERAMGAVAKGQKLKGDAREGLARMLALRLPEMSKILMFGERPTNPGILNVDPEEITKALAEVARDKEGRETLMVGLGTYAAKTYDRMAELMASGADNGKIHQNFQTEMRSMGEAFCSMADAVRNAGIKEREEAAALLSRYQLGVGIAFEILDKIPVVSTAKGIAEKVPGGFAGKMEGNLKEGLAAELSGVDTRKILATTQQTTRQSLSQVDAMVVESLMGSMAHRPQLLYDAGMTTWDQYPPFMLKDPPPAPGTTLRPGADLAGDLALHVKPEFLDQRGGIRLPVPGGSGYKEFRQWYMFESGDDNPLWEKASAVTSEVRSQMNGCFARIGFEASA